MTDLTVTNFEDLDNSISFANDLRNRKTPAEIEAGVNKANSAIQDVENLAALRNVTK